MPASVSIDFKSSDFIFTVSYPMWGGYKIVHDPYFAVYTSSTEGTGTAGSSTTLIIVAAVAVVFIASAVVVMRRRK
jgi:hypothetical protein